MNIFGKTTKLHKLPVLYSHLRQQLRGESRIVSPWHDFVKDHHPPPSIKIWPSAKYGGEYLVTMLTGDNVIGFQGANYIKHLFGVAKVPIVFEHIAIGYDQKGLKAAYLQSVRRNRYAMQVDLQHDPEEKHKSLLLNNDLDLYVCLIKVNSIKGFRCKVPDLALTLILQNNTGNFTKLEYEPVKGIVETLKICEERYIRRYFQFVFQYAQENHLRRVTFGHNADELPLSDGMYVEIANQLHCEQFPNIKFESMLIHNMVRALVMKPECFEVICTTDRYGTFVASVASAVCGGASLFSATERGDHHAVFKPLQTRLSVTDAHTLSPYGIVRSCIDLLKHLGEDNCANVLWDELMTTMICRGIRTREFGGTDSGEFVICDIANRLRCKFY